MPIKVMEFREQTVKEAEALLARAETTLERHDARARLTRAKRALEARQQWEQAGDAKNEKVRGKDAT